MFLWLLLAFTQDSLIPRFDVHTADSTTIMGPLDRIEQDWSVTLDVKENKRIEGKNLVSLRRSGRLMPGPPQTEQVVFINGDRVPGSAVQLNGERLRFLAALGQRGQEWNLPLSALSVLWLTAPERREDLPPAFQRASSTRRKRDLVLLRNRDLVEGSLTAFDGKQLRLDVSGKELTLDRAKVTAIAFSSELTRLPRPKGPYARLVTVQGARLTLQSALADEQVLNGKTLFGAGVTVPIEQIAGLDLYQGRAVYLSELKPKQYEHTPYFSVAWPLAPDATVVGQELRLGGGVFDKGLGMHSAARVSYELAGGYQWFETLVGLDDQTGREGHVVVRVLLDGKDALGPMELSGGDEPKPIKLKVAGARELTLVVEFGKQGDVRDHVDWVEARLLK